MPSVLARVAVAAMPACSPALCCRSSAIAAVPASVRAGVEARAKRHSQRIISGRQGLRMYSGLVGSNSQRSPWATTPGAAIGTAWLGQTSPWLP